jgi:hypothetical protein
MPRTMSLMESKWTNAELNPHRGLDLIHRGAILVR